MLSVVKGAFIGSQGDVGVPRLSVEQKVGLATVSSVAIPFLILGGVIYLAMKGLGCLKQAGRYVIAGVCLPFERLAFKKMLKQVLMASEAVVRARANVEPSSPRKKFQEAAALAREVDDTSDGVVADQAGIDEALARDFAKEHGGMIAKAALMQIEWDGYRHDLPNPLLRPELLYRVNPSGFQVLIPVLGEGNFIDLSRVNSDAGKKVAQIGCDIRGLARRLFGLFAR
ncbi:MAG: hypothetical protein S4CHLAM102_01460 [Chlamydiia bacterium]|nr:hypothetical protein [Chlamydiia bacterium]